MNVKRLNEIRSALVDLCWELDDLSLDDARDAVDEAIVEIDRLLR